MKIILWIIAALLNFICCINDIHAAYKAAIQHNEYELMGFLAVLALNIYAFNLCLNNIIKKYGNSK